MKTTALFICYGLLLIGIVAVVYGYRHTTAKQKAAPSASSCLEEQHELRRQGYSEAEIEIHAKEEVAKLYRAGFSKAEIAECFGVK